MATPSPTPSGASPGAQGLSPNYRITGAPSPSAEDFLREAIEAARRTQAATGIPASVTVAQAILETNWGQLHIGVHNYFGIKADYRPGPAGLVTVPTMEFIEGEWVKVLANFRAYATMEQSFIDHAQLLSSNERYAEAMRHRDDPREFIRQVHLAGYATDPIYTEKIVRIMDGLDLYRYNQPALATGALPTLGPAAYAALAIPTLTSAVGAGVLVTITPLPAATVSPLVARFVPQPVVEVPGGQQPPSPAASPSLPLTEGAAYGKSAELSARNPGSLAPAGASPVVRTDPEDGAESPVSDDPLGWVVMLVCLPVVVYGATDALRNRR